MKKDETIIELLKWLHRHLGENINVVDYWESDLCAIGVTARTTPEKLIYISTYNSQPGYYQINLEGKPRQMSIVNREELLHAVREHFNV